MQIIGRMVLISLPDQGLEDIKAKADTGAYHSAIHCHDVRVVKSVDGKDVLSVRFLDPAHSSYNNKELTFKKFSTASVTSSFGQKQERYIVRLKVVIDGRTYEEEFTLADRSSMRFPILLGRTLLKNRFMVDVSKYRIKAAE